MLAGSTKKSHGNRPLEWAKPLGSLYSIVSRHHVYIQAQSLEVIEATLRPGEGICCPDGGVLEMEGRDNSPPLHRSRHPTPAPASPCGRRIVIGFRSTFIVSEEQTQSHKKSFMYRENVQGVKLPFPVVPLTCTISTMCLWYYIYCRRLSCQCPKRGL